MGTARFIGICSSLLLIAAGSAMAAPVDASLREPQLEALISATLVDSPIVAARRGDLVAARHEIDAARWQFAPSLSTQLQRGSGSAYQYASSVRADQRLYTGGRLTADLEGARARRDSAVLAVQEIGLGVALQVVAAWQSLQAANGRLTATAAYQVRLNDFSDTINRRIDSGVSPASERSLMNARMAQAQNELSTARAAAQSARATLRMLSGSAPAVDSEARLVSNLPPMSLLCADNADGDARVAAATDRSPAMRRIGQDIEAARRALESQRAALKPTLALRVEQPVGALPEGVSRAARVSVLVEYSTDAGLSALARTNAGDARLGALASQAQALRREIGQQIRTECAEQTGLAERNTGLLRARDYTQDVLGSYTRLFLAGKRGWLDVLNAAREDFDNEVAAFATSTALRASAYRLSLLGGDYALGLPEPGDEPPPAPLLPGITPPTEPNPS
ncbi:MAG: TolC family protein [Rhizobacter sp.]